MLALVVSVTVVAVFVIPAAVLAWLVFSDISLTQAAQLVTISVGFMTYLTVAFAVVFYLWRKHQRVGQLDWLIALAVAQANIDLRETWNSIDNEPPQRPVSLDRALSAKKNLDLVDRYMGTSIFKFISNVDELNDERNFWNRVVHAATILASILILSLFAITFITVVVITDDPVATVIGMVAGGFVVVFGFSASWVRNYRYRKTPQQDVPQ